ncbi:MAG TPA: hypothetical protein VGQ04_04815 [Chitinophagaceae bacterium]|nr:hypothetical protein [Chitinophagaceae bacterium]
MFHQVLLFEFSFSNDVGKDSTITTVTKYTYESHDDMGNWTQRTTWNDKGKQQVLQRE